MPRREFGAGGIEALLYTGGHTQVRKSGYVLEYCPNHPACNARGMVLQHRLVMERHLGRLLSGVEVVHHLNGDPADNRLENLALLQGQSEHIRQHAKGSAKRYSQAFHDALRAAMADESETLQSAAKRLGASPMTIEAALREMGETWPSRVVCHKARHAREFVLHTLQTCSRKEACRILGMSVMSLWRWYGEEMQQTARTKSLAGGGRLGGTVKRWSREIPQHIP